MIAQLNQILRAVLPGADFSAGARNTTTGRLIVRFDLQADTGMIRCP
jgi:hypothetical protein